MQLMSHKNILHGYIHSNTIIRENRNFHEHNLRNNDNLRNESHNYTGFHLKRLLYYKSETFTLFIYIEL
jgi:hypothetical protein